MAVLFIIRRAKSTSPQWLTEEYALMYFKIFLQDGAKSAVNDTYSGKDNKYPGQFMRRFRHQEHSHAETTVSSEFHQYSGMKHRNGSRCRA